MKRTSCWKSAVLLAVVLCILVSTCILPASAEVVKSGKCGENVTWTLDSNGTLTLSGTGATDGYRNDGWPWTAEMESIRKVVVKEGITELGEFLFFDCPNLQSAVLPDGLLTIGVDAFGKCENMKEVNIPDSVTSIESYAFTYCVSLDNIVIPEGVTEINSFSFCNCKSLTNITLPDSITSIGREAFRWCSSLTTITLPKNLTIIKNSAFNDCANLKEIVLPNGITRIYGYCFYMCKNLTTISIPVSMTYGEEGAFERCDSLSTVKYAGTREQWNAVNIRWNNEPLKKAQIICAGENAVDAPVVKGSSVAASGANKLTWDAVDGAVSYKVYRATKKDGTYYLRTTTTKLSFISTTSHPGVTYYYKVKAVDANGVESPYSDIVTITTDLARPTLTLKAGEGKITLRWEQIPGATGYKIYRAVGDGEYKLLKTIDTGDRVSFTNTNLVSGETYHYKMKAIMDGNTAATSAYSKAQYTTAN